MIAIYNFPVFCKSCYLREIGSQWLLHTFCIFFVEAVIWWERLAAYYCYIHLLVFFVESVIWEVKRRIWERSGATDVFIRYIPSNKHTDKSKGSIDGGWRGVRKGCGGISKQWVMFFFYLFLLRKVTELWPISSDLKLSMGVLLYFCKNCLLKLLNKLM